MNTLPLVIMNRTDVVLQGWTVYLLPTIFVKKPAAKKSLRCTWTTVTAIQPRQFV